LLESNRQMPVDGDPLFGAMCHNESLSATVLVPGNGTRLWMRDCDSMRTQYNYAFCCSLFLAPGAALGHSLSLEQTLELRRFGFGPQLCTANHKLDVSNPQLGTLAVTPYVAQSDVAVPVVPNRVEPPPIMPRQADNDYFGGSKTLVSIARKLESNIVPGTSTLLRFRNSCVLESTQCFWSSTIVLGDM
jgi:hypothetical protein